MKFIKELVEEVNIIVEENSEVPNGKKSYFIDGIYIQADKANRNGRVYPMDIIGKEVNRYKESFIDTKRALGELGHPETGSINLDRASHLITKLEQNGNDFVGRAKILDTPHGKIAKNFIDEGVKLGVSTRGFGTLKEADSKGIQEVCPDFHLATVDIVADPSAPDAFVNGIMEGRDYYLTESGLIVERKVEKLKKEVKKLTKVQIDEGKLLTLFEDFMKNL